MREKVLGIRRALRPGECPEDGYDWEQALRRCNGDHGKWWAFRESIGREHVPDLRGRDLRGLDLRRFYLHGARLDGADLRGCLLDGATLDRGSLQGADVRNVSLEDASMVDVSMKGWRDENVNMKNARFWPDGCDPNAGKASGVGIEPMIKRCVFTKVDAPDDNTPEGWKRGF